MVRNQFKLFADFKCNGAIIRITLKSIEPITSLTGGISLITKIKPDVKVDYIAFFNKTIKHLVFC